MDIWRCNELLSNFLSIVFHFAKLKLKTYASSCYHCDQLQNPLIERHLMSGKSRPVKNKVQVVYFRASSEMNLFEFLLPSTRQSVAKG